MRRRLLVGAALAIAAVLLLYAAAGHWLAPRLLRDALEERAAALGMTLSVEALRTDPFRLAVELSGVELAGPGGDRLAAARAIRADLSWASFWRDAWIVERASVHAPQAELTPGAQGALNWPASGPDGNGQARAAALRVKLLTVAEGTLRFGDELTLEGLRLEVHDLATHEGEAQYRLSARLAQGGTLASEGKLSLAQGALVLREVHAEATDIAYSGVAARKVTLEAARLALPPQQPIELSARAQFERGGELAAHGRLAPRPLAAELSVQAASVPLALAQRLLPASLAVDIASGTVSGRGRLRLAEQRSAYEGSLEVAGLELEERDTQRPLLGWKLARTDSLAVASAPAALEIGELVVHDPHGRLVIEKDGSVNFGALFRGGAAESGAAFNASVRRVSLENGSLDFADRSLETPFEVAMRELSGTVTGFSTAPGDPARVQLAGRVGEYGSVRIRGSIDLDEPKSLADVTARFRNVDLASLTPYVVKFAGYRVRSGRASADLRYRVREGELSGQNQLVFQELQLGEKVEGAPAAELPLELAVALLSDASGRITLDVPVRGDLNDPQFDFGGLVARALANTIGKIVSAPFRALASFLGDGRGRERGEVRFAAGSAALSPPQEEAVAKLAQALAQRPQLAVAVRAGFDPQRDAAALRREAARREIARRAGYKTAGPLDFTDPKILRAAERLYLERIGKRADLRALRGEAPRYGRALVELLAYIEPADAASAEQLARERARSVRLALLEHGVEPARVTLEAPATETAADGGVPTRLALLRLG